MIGVEYRYTSIERECLALVFAVQKMRYYLMGQAIHVVSKVNPLKILMTQSGSLITRLPKWVILLSQYDMKFVSQKIVKGQAIVDFLANHPISKSSKLYKTIPDEVMTININLQDEVWQIFFDVAVRVRPKGKVILE